MAVTKKDIVMQVASETGIKQIYVKKVLQRTLDCITKSLVKGETVELRNFGIFKVKSRKGRTGQEVPVPPKKVAIFKPGLIMKRDIR